MSDVVIDLGELPHAGDRAARPRGLRSPRPYRPALAVLTVALIAALAGAAPQLEPKPPIVVPARLSDALFVGIDQFFVVSAGPKVPGSVVENKIISTYGLPFGNLLSLTSVAVSGAIFDVTAVGDTVLVSYQVDAAGAEATVALAAGTGVARWRRPARMLGVSGRDGIVVLRENSPEVGALNWYGIALSTGDERWHLQQPDGGYLTDADWADGFPRRLISVDPYGHLVVRNTVDGSIDAAATIPVPGDWAKQGIALWPDRDLVLVGDHAATSAYALPDLTLRWQTAVDLYSAYIGPSCGDAVCFFSPRGGGMLVVDRDTGRGRWSSGRWSYADQVGPYLLAGSDERTDGSHTLDVVDTLSGHVRGDFGGWQDIGAPRPDGTVVGLREHDTDDAVWYAALNPAKLSTRILGVADHVSGDCQTTPDVLICRRTDSSVGIWRLTGQ